MGCSKLAVSGILPSRGVVAKDKILGSTAVVSMPHSLALSTVAGEQCPMPDLVPAKLWDVSDE